MFLFAGGAGARVRLYGSTGAQLPQIHNRVHAGRQ